MRTTLLSAAMAATTLMAAASVAAAPGDKPINVPGWLECAGTAGGFDVTLTELGDVPLVPTAPSSSVTSGAGCASLDGLAFAGELEAGVVDAITVSLDWMGAGAERGGQDFDISGTVTIDDVAFPVELTISPVGANDAGFGPVTYDIEFTLTDLAAELPESTGTRAIQVAIGIPGTGGVPWTGPGMWVWGTSEVPAGVVLHEVAPD